MSAAMISSLTFAAKELSIYFAITILIAGTMGGLLNFLVFLSLKTFRESSCAFYLIVMSFANVGQMLTGLLARIMDTGFDIDWSKSSQFFCKFRFYCFQTCALISMTGLCLSIIDQYFATCSRPRWQQWSNIKIAQRISVVFILIWITHDIPYLVYYNHVRSNSTSTVTCAYTNTFYRFYANYSTNTLLGKILPTIVAFIFGILAYRNVQQLSHRTLPLVRRELDRQLTAMVLLLVAFAVIIMVPYTIIYFLTLVPQLTNDPLINAQVQFALTVMIHFLYLYFASPFYIFIFASSRFRRQLFYVLFEIYFKHRRQPAAALNQVAPEFQ